jgi:arylsulfatase A-like enzyme
VSGDASPPAPRPDVVVLVLDAVRYDAFQQVFGQPDLPLRELGALSDLRKESVRFDRTASTSPWTVPSHTSLFTGLYPWQHGTHAKGTLELGPGFSLIAEILRSAGYRTICLSANAFLAPESGLVRGFDTVRVASWRAPFFRWGALERGVAAGTETHPYGPSEDRSSADRAMSLLEAQVLSRYPGLLDIWNRLARRLRPKEFDPSSLSVSPWIEPTLTRWVDALEPDRPFYAFINLLDAHGPYLTDLRQPLGLRDWWALMRVSQAQAHHILHPQAFTPAVREILWSLYLQTIANLASRVGRLVASLQERGRWENTLFVLTSDHGQSFGEHGWLFHGFRVDEPLIRIPLWVRFPFARHSGASPRTWASLIDVAPTVVRAAGGVPPAEFPGVPLEALLERNHREPVLAVADGVQDRIRSARWLPPAKFQELDQIRVAAYAGDRKVILTQGAFPAQAFNPMTDSAEAQDLWATESAQLAPLQAVADEALQAMLASEKRTVPSSVRDRLASWGYV